MPDFNQLLLFLHFVGLGLGMANGFGNLVMGRLIEAAPASEKAVLGRYPPLMSQLGGAGLLLLWATGLVMVFTKWGGFGSLPWQFHAKLTAVVLLTGAVGMIHANQAKARRGDQAAATRIPAIGLAATVLTLVTVLLAVLAFN